MSADILEFKRGVKLTGPDMVLALWIARVAMEDRRCYDFIQHELEFKGDEASRVYNAIRDFLEVSDGQRH